MFELDDDSIVTLTDDQGEDIDFILLDVVEFDGSDYMVLLPLEDDAADGDDEEDEVLILKVEKDDEGEKYLGVEDETVLNAVLDLFQKKLDAAMEEESAEEGSEE